MLNSSTEEILLSAGERVARIWFPDSICGITKARILGIWGFKTIKRFSPLINVMIEV